MLCAEIPEPAGWGEASFLAFEQLMGCGRDLTVMGKKKSPCCCDRTHIRGLVSVSAAVTDTSHAQDLAAPGVNLQEVKAQRSAVSGLVTA